MPALIPTTFSRVSDLYDRAQISGGANVLYVDPDNGSDSTGSRGRRELPFATLLAAQTAASSGDWIKATPANHAVALYDSLGKDGVNFDLTGASVVKSGEVSSDATVTPIFNLVNVSCSIIGHPALLFALTESEADIAGSQVPWAMILNGGASTMRLEIGDVGGELAFDAGDGFRGIQHIDGAVTGDFGAIDYEMLAGTLIAHFRNSPALSVTGGSAKISAETIGLLACASTAILIASAAQINSVSQTGGTLNLSCGQLNSLASTAGKFNVVAGSIITGAAISGTASGSITASFIESFSRTGSNTTSPVVVRCGIYGSATRTDPAIVVRSDAGAQTQIDGGFLHFSSGGLGQIFLKTGKIYVRNLRGIDDGAGLTQGSRYAWIIGSDTGGDALANITLDNCSLKCTNANHFGVVITSESDINNVYKIFGGYYQGGNGTLSGGQIATWLAGESNRTVYLEGTVTANGAVPTEDPFTITLAGTGNLVINSGLSL